MDVLRWGFAIFLLFFTTASQPVQAEEFDCDVTVDYSQLSGSEYTFLEDLEEQISDYINEQSWTEDRFLEHERIDCQMQVVVEEAPTLSSFSARLIVAMRRPIYNTTQHSTVLQINDSPWQFGYTRGTSLTRTPERYDPLTSVLDFYAHLMLGYDYDTFSELGGTPFFEQARRIAQMARTEQAAGWSQVGEQQGRSALISQLLDTRFQPLRKAYFNYHFGGLDHFVLDTETARATMLEVLRNLQALDQDVSRQYALDLFFSAKSKELASVFEDSDLSSEAYALLTSMDSSSEYERLVQ